MGWASTPVVEIEEQATFNFRYQYALVDDRWREANPDEESGFNDDDEVVRRIRQNIISVRYPGLTKTAAAELLDDLRDDDEYGSATAIWNGAGGYDVVGERVLVDPEGWSDWILVEDLDSF